jgi:hypothetical protein
MDLDGYGYVEEPDPEGEYVRFDELLPSEDLCDCDSEPIRGIKAGRHLPSCRYGIVIDWLDIRDPRAEAR